MATIFLIGGTGNQLFQFASADPKDQFSTFFLNGRVRKFLNWTNHEQFFSFPPQGFLKHLLALIILAVDVVFIKVVKISLFTEFDLRFLKQKPYFHRLVAIGYFQSHPMLRDVSELSKQLRLQAVQSDLPKICLHIRGGDLVKSHSDATSPYGVLSPMYYQKALEFLNVVNGQSILVHTDDIEYANYICGKIHTNSTFDIRITDLGEMIADAVVSDVFIASNSTLAFWIVHLRPRNAENVVPRPFQRRSDVTWETPVQTIDVNY